MPGLEQGSSRGFCLFITLPSGQVVTLKDLPKSVSLKDIFYRLELLAGLPCEVYQLRRTDGSLVEADSCLEYGNNVHDGTVIKVQLRSGFNAIYRALHKNQVVELITALNTDTSLDPAEHNQTDDGRRAFLALYMAAGLGHITLCRKLIKTGADVSMVTSFNHSALHAAAASDCLGAVQLLIQCGCRVSTPDINGVTALTVARQQGAASCERWMRLWCLSAEGWEREHSAPSSSKLGESTLCGQGNSRDTTGQFHEDDSEISTTVALHKPRVSIRQGAASMDLLTVQTVSTQARKSAESCRSRSPSGKRRARRRKKSPSATSSVSWATPSWSTAKQEQENRWLGNSLSEEGFTCRIAPGKSYALTPRAMQSPRASKPSPRASPKQLKKTRIDIDLRSAASDGDGEGSERMRSRTGSDSSSSRESKVDGSERQQKAYLEWLEEKKETLKDIMKRQQERAVGNSIKEKDKNRIISVFRLGDTDPTPARLPDPAEYAKSYQRWKTERAHFAGGEIRRRGSIIDPETYEEWLEKKERSLLRRNSMPAVKLSASQERNVMILADLSQNKSKKSARKVTWKQDNPELMT